MSFHIVRAGNRTHTRCAQPYGDIMRYDGTQVVQLTDNQWEDGGPALQPGSGTAAPAKAR